jgi:DNA ligase-1
MALFLQLAQLAHAIAATPSRLQKRATIASAIAAVHLASPAGNDAGLFAQYLSGAPFAESDPRKLSAGGALLSRAVLAVSGASDAALTAAYRRHGDLGAAAFDLFTPLPANPPTLTLSDVTDTFAELASARTTAARAALVESLLRRATPIEVNYLLKLMLGDMRIGVKQSLVEEAIAAAANSPEIRMPHLSQPHCDELDQSTPAPTTATPVTPAQVRHAVMLEADLASATARAFAGTLHLARMKPFHPLGFMLASPVDTPEDAIVRFTASPIEQRASESDTEQPVLHAFLEDKYDGIRAQLHCDDPAQPTRVALYSRNREDITESFPELAEAFARIPSTTNGPLILDGEILAWSFAPTNPGNTVPPSAQSHRDEWESTTVSPPTAHALPFTILTQRIGRKRVSNDLRSRIPVVFMAFDLLAEAGTLTLDLPLHTRRSRLEAIVEQLTPHTTSPLEPPTQQAAQSHLFERTTENEERTTAFPRLLLSPSRLVESAEDIDRAYAAARARSNEGIMLKAANSQYQPGRRGLAWLKLKRELATLDVVITGAEYGHGRRATLLSDYTFAVRSHNASDSAYGPAELLNVGKAYSGVTDAEIADLTEFLKAHTLEDHGHFRTVEPLVVLEVAFNNIMRSDRHASGFALRFPRIVRLRPDKPLAEIDTLARVEEIYRSQVDKPAEG